MALTYEKIATTTLTSDQIGIEFTSIPGTYTDLVAVVAVKGGSVSYEVGHARVNGVSSAVYSSTTLGVGQTSTVVSPGSLNHTSFRTFSSDGGNVDLYAPQIWNFMNYANTNTFKTVLRTIKGQYGLFSVVGTWRSTNAITSIYFATEGFSASYFLNGSTATLYGIKAA